MTLPEEIWEEEGATTFRLRGKQPEWIDATFKALEKHSRLLFIAPGGVGKTECIGAVAARLWNQRRGKTLVLENRDRLTTQTAERIESRTGLNVDIEMANRRASPFAEIVVASTQSYSRIPRLTGFDPNHFAAVIPDECHFSLSNTHQRILKYHHYGAESLDENWVKPEDGLYVPKASIIGFTASPNLGTKRNLGEFYQEKCVEYSYLDSVRDGWLVGIREENIPVKIDTRKFRVKRNSEGADFNSVDQSEAIKPVIPALGAQLVERAFRRKTICFMPSIECCVMMADWLNANGLNAIFVSGACLDKNEKTDQFHASGKGTVLVNCALHVYGSDFPDVDCVAIFSAVISTVNYVQKVYRSTRVLPGIVTDEMTAEQRRAAIAASDKPFSLLLSPFFISDRISICSPCDLFTSDPDVKKRMKEIGGTDYGAALEKAQRDSFKALERAAKAVANRASRVINPISWALSIGNEKLSSYQPQDARDARPVTPGQANLLRQFHMQLDKITCFGMADMVIGQILHRARKNMASPGQLDMLHVLGVSDEQAALLSKAEAEETIKALKANKPATQSPSLQQAHQATVSQLETVCEEEW